MEGQCLDLFSGFTVSVNDLLPAEAIQGMVIDHAHRLHMRIAEGRGVRKPFSFQL
jgi:hypothetical protein